MCVCKYICACVCVDVDVKGQFVKPINHVTWERDVSVTSHKQATCLVLIGRRFLIPGLSRTGVLSGLQ